MPERAIPFIPFHVYFHWLLSAFVKAALGNARTPSARPRAPCLVPTSPLSTASCTTTRAPVHTTWWTLTTSTSRWTTEPTAGGGQTCTRCASRASPSTPLRKPWWSWNRRWRYSFVAIRYPLCFRYSVNCLIIMNLYLHGKKLERNQHEKIKYIFLGID